MKKLTTFLLVSISLLILTASPILSQTPSEDSAKKYDISYPISELGNCADYSSCRSYCDDSFHQDACVVFAKKKGFYQEKPLNEKKAQIMAMAKAKLGCDSEESCRQVCGLEANFEKCQNFAQKNGLDEGQKLNVKNQEIFSKAKEILGCDSPSACKSICENEANKEKCSEFAKQSGLRGGEKRIGPGGCNSEESCKAFCSDPNNFSECSKFGGGAGPENPNDQKGPPGEFRGPGGCDSESACRSYCEKNPAECQKFGPGPKESINDDQKPLFDKNIKPEEMEKFCRENPEKCKEMKGQNKGPGPTIKEGEFQPNQPGNFNLGTECANQGCSFNGTTCICPQSGGEQRPPGNQPPNGGNQPPPQGNQPPPDNQPPPQGDQPPPQVRGTTSYRSFWEVILDFIFRRKE